MSKSKFYWQHPILLTQSSPFLAGWISLITISTSGELGLIPSSGSPQLCSLWPLEARPHCHNTSYMSSTTHRLLIDIESSPEMIIKSPDHFLSVKDSVGFLRVNQGIRNPSQTKRFHPKPFVQVSNSRLWRDP
jgi:hypothetical protein